MPSEPFRHDPLADLTDDRLLELARDGDVDAFGTILARHAPWLMGRAKELWKARSATRSANDWVATVHRRALADFRGHHTEIRSLRGWLLTILRHAVIDAVRRRGGRPEEVTWTESLFAADSTAVPQRAEHHEQLDLAQRRIAQLSPQDQSILEWSFQDSLSDREIADRLGMKTDAVKKRRQRALQQVRNTIDPAQQPPEENEA